MMTRPRRFASLGLAAIVALTSVQAQSPPRIKSDATVTLGAEIIGLAAIYRSASVAAGLADGRIAVWNGRDGVPALVLKPHAARVLAVGSTSDGRGIWSVASDGTLARSPIGAAGAPTMRKIDLGSAPTRVAAFSPDGSILVTGGEYGEIRVFDTASGTLKQQLRGHRTELQALAVQHGSKVVASASAESDLRLWDTAAGGEITSIEGDLSLFALAFSPRDGTLASGGVDRRLTLRDPATFKTAGVLTLQAPMMVGAVAWSPDGRVIALADVDDETLAKGGIVLVDALRRTRLAALDTGGTPAPALVFTADGSSVVAILGRDLRAWRIAGASRVSQ